MTTISDLELMRVHVDAMYTNDGHGKIVSINDGLRGPAPRFWFGSTPSGNIWRFRNDVAENLVRSLEALSQDEPDLGEPLCRSPIHLGEFVCLLEPAQDSYAGPTYWFAASVPRTGDAVEVNASNADLLQKDLEDWIAAVPYGPCMVSLAAGNAASVCCSARITKKAHAAGVETVPAHRRRGHAAWAVAAWASEVQRQGVIALYGTSWENTASQNVAARLGLSMFGAEFYIA